MRNGHPTTRSEPVRSSFEGIDADHADKALAGHPALPGLVSAAPLSLRPLHGGFCKVFDAQGLELGNLRLLRGRWTFKALGFDDQGQVVPGGGPLTHHHNLSFDALDEKTISAQLLAAKA